MQEHRFDWHPSPEEVGRIVEEMRPIIEQFVRRSRQERSGRVEGAALGTPDENATERPLVATGAR